MPIHELLREAWAETEKAGLPEHIHEVAFTHAVAMLGGAASTAPATATGAAPERLAAAKEATSPSAPPAHVSTDELFVELESETGVSRDKLESIFYFHERIPGISVRSHKLGKNKAEQTRSVALLLFCAHYFALNANELSVEAVRTECETLKCYDQANFSATLEKIKGVNYTGPRGKKVLRFRPDTIEKFQEKVTVILGDES